MLLFLNPTILVLRLVTEKLQYPMALFAHFLLARYNMTVADMHQTSEQPVAKLQVRKTGERRPALKMVLL